MDDPPRSSREIIALKDAWEPVFALRQFGAGPDRRLF
jgi:hypothetical protein